jgi:hypothetical protein
MIKNNRTPPSLQLNLRAKLCFTSNELQEFRCVRPASPDQDLSPFGRRVLIFHQQEVRLLTPIWFDS